jgi:hypothetical protein
VVLVVVEQVKLEQLELVLKDRVLVVMEEQVLLQV